jgi:hypothetical protein
MRIICAWRLVKGDYSIAFDLKRCDFHVLLRHNNRLLQSCTASSTVDGASKLAVVIDAAQREAASPAEVQKLEWLHYQHCVVSCLHCEYRMAASYTASDSWRTCFCMALLFPSYPSLFKRAVTWSGIECSTGCPFLSRYMERRC